MNNEINLTELELIALKSITYSDFYQNGRKSCVWDFSVYDIYNFIWKDEIDLFKQVENISQSFRSNSSEAIISPEINRIGKRI